MRRSSSNQSKSKFFFRITVPLYGIDTTLYFDNYKCKKVGFRLTVVCAMTRFNHVVMTDLSKATLTLVMADVCYMLSVLASTDVRDLRIPKSRVLARISKVPVQNSNFKKFTRPDLATYLPQFLIPATFNSLVCQKGQFALQLCP